MFCCVGIWHKFKTLPCFSNLNAPVQRSVNYNAFNKSKEIYTLSNDRTRKTSLVYDAEDRRILKSIHNMNAEYHPADSDARSPEYSADPPEPEDDPISMRAVEPGFMFESATCHLGNYLEKTTRDGENWEDVKYIFAAGQRIAKIDSDGVHYFHKDHVGKTNVVTDKTGEIRKWHADGAEKPRWNKGKGGFHRAGAD